eukprot:gb/GECG01016406.1/.p1 GENE.gb/GECG01016406.1/~~gb/GECG01016406.1/.p1  ORF type:complete len:127 (+),score=15.32 gb/GECG01016406.1/:1-381(+)
MCARFRTWKTGEATLEAELEVWNKLSLTVDYREPMEEQGQGQQEGMIIGLDGEGNRKQLREGEDRKALSALMCRNKAPRTEETLRKLEELHPPEGGDEKQKLAAIRQEGPQETTPYQASTSAVNKV